MSFMFFTPLLLFWIKLDYEFRWDLTYDCSYLMLMAKWIHLIEEPVIIVPKEPLKWGSIWNLCRKKGTVCCSLPPRAQTVFVVEIRKLRDCGIMRYVLYLLLWHRKWNWHEIIITFTRMAVYYQSHETASLKLVSKHCILSISIWSVLSPCKPHSHASTAMHTGDNLHDLSTH